MTDTQIDELLAGITQGEWEVIAGDNCGTYGNGPDTHEGFVSYAVVDSKGRTIVDTYNSTVGEIHEEFDEDGHSAWDEAGRCNTAFIAAAPALVAQLRSRVVELEGRNCQVTIFGCGCTVQQDGLDAEPRLYHCEELESLRTRLQQVEARTADLENRGHQIVLFGCGCIFKQDGLDVEPRLTCHDVHERLRQAEAERDGLRAEVKALNESLAMLTGF